MPTIFTTTASTRTVKPTQTTFTNRTGGTVTLNFQNGGSLLLEHDVTSAKISTTISGINRGAINYYDSSPNDYVIPANRAVVLTLVDGTISMDVP